MKKITLFLLVHIASCVICQPTFIWAGEITGPSAGGAQSQSIATDKYGNIYTAGWFYGLVDFDPGPATYTLTTPTGNGGNQVFISKLSSSGNFIWAKQFTGSIYQYGYSVFVDQNANIYVGGSFGNTVDFDPGASVYNLTSKGYEDMFLCKLDSNGNFLWAHSAGNTGYDIISSIKTDKNNNVYATGYFQNIVDFDPGPTTYTLNGNTFAWKFDSNGNFLWAKALSGGGSSGSEIVIDNKDQIIIGGTFGGPVDFDPGPGIYKINTGINQSSFLWKLDSIGNMIWARNIGESSGETSLYSIDVDNLNNIYTTGVFIDSVDFEAGGGVTMMYSKGSKDAYMSKLDDQGNFLFAKSIGGKGYDAINAMSHKSSFGYYITGAILDSMDFDPGPGIFFLSKSTIWGDIFVAEYDNNGQFICAGAMNGYGPNYGSAIVAKNDIIYSTGSFIGPTDFDPGAGSFTLNNNGMYVSKLKGCDVILNVTNDKTGLSGEFFPNPSNGKITFHSSIPEQCMFEIKIINCLGQIIHAEKAVHQGGELNKTLYLERETKGIYFAEITLGNEKSVKKFVLE
jgi:hypothetical protein